MGARPGQAAPTPVAARRLVIGTTIAEQLTTSFFPHLAVFVDAGWDVHLVCAPGEWPSGPPPVDVAVHRIPMAKVISPRDDARALAAWVALLRELRPNVVIGASPKGGLLAMTAGRITRVPRRVFLHRGARWETLVGTQRRLTVAAERATIANATDVVAVSNSLASLVVAEGIARRRPVVLGAGGSKGVDLQRFRPLGLADGSAGVGPRADGRRGTSSADGPPGGSAQDGRPNEAAADPQLTTPPTLGFVGRLAQDKGLDVLLAALAAVRTDYPDARLVVAGDVDEADPPPPEVLARLAADPAVELLGWRRDLESIIPGFDVLVFPSAREGLPNAVIEAAACGVPTVGWDVTGVRDAVAQGRSGRLVPWRDVPAFAEAVRQVAEPVDRERWRASSRVWAERFDTRRVSALWVELLDLPPGRVPHGGGADPQPTPLTKPVTRRDSLGVVVVAYRSQATMAACLSSLATHAPGAHVVVMDNSGEAEALRGIAAGIEGATPAAASATAGRFASLRIEDSGGNLGYARAVNRAVALLPDSCEYLLILNPDVELTADPLLLVDRLEHADVTAGRLRAPMSNAKREVTYGSVLRGAALGAASLGVAVAPGTGDVFVPHLDGAYLLQRLDFYRAHPMDEAFELYYEDAAYCDGARAGRGVLLADLDVGDHIGGASSGGSTMSPTAYTAARVSRARYLHRRYPQLRGAALMLPFAVERATRSLTARGEGAEARRQAWRAVRDEVREPGSVRVLGATAAQGAAQGVPPAQGAAQGVPLAQGAAPPAAAITTAPRIPPLTPGPAAAAAPGTYPGLTALTPYGPATASTRVRVREWIDRTGIDARVIDYAGLPQHSFGVLARNPAAVARAERRQRALAKERFERLLIHKEVTPFSSGGLAEQLVARSDLSIYDFDDAIMWTDQLATNSRWSASGIAKRVWSKSAACERTVVAVDRVIAGSEVLAEWAAERNADVRMIPSCVDTAIYPAKTDYELGGGSSDPHPGREAGAPATTTAEGATITAEPATTTAERASSATPASADAAATRTAAPRLVWLGSPATEYNLALVAPALLRLHATTGARLTVISGGAADLGPLAAIVDRVPWRPGIETTLGDYDLGIAPLTDSPYERGKCAYKILQYAAAGLPVVASPVGANAKVLADLGQQGAADEAAWLDALADVIRASSADRARAGAAARAGVVAGYSFDAWTGAWLEAVGDAGV